LVDEPKPKKSGRRRVKDLNTPLTIKEKKARKSAQDLLRERKEQLEKAQNNYWSTKSKLKKIDNVLEGKKQLIEKDKIEETTPNIREAIKDREVIFEPNEGPQTEFLASSEREVFYGGARGGGKSYAMLVDPLRYCDKQKHRALLIRRTMPELRDLINHSQQLYPKAYPGAKWREQEKEWKFPSGARIEFGYAENLTDALRYQGQSYTWIGIDELPQYPTEDIYNFLRSSLRSVDPQTDDYYAMLASLPEVQRKQFLDGNWEAFEDSSFPEFSKEVHVIKPFDIPRNWMRFRACDWGYSSPACCLWIAVDFDNNLFVYRELYTKKITADLFARKVLEQEHGEYIRYGVLDSSTWARRGDIGPSIAETMILEGCRWRPSDRSPRSRIAGKLEIHKRLKLDENTGYPSLFVLDNCVNLIRTLPMLPTDKNNPEDVDTHAEDHAYDALRYGCMSRPVHPIRQDFIDKTNEPKHIAPADRVFGY
jgi:hypothetical protein